MEKVQAIKLDIMDVQYFVQQMNIDDEHIHNILQWVLLKTPELVTYVEHLRYHGKVHVSKNQHSQHANVRYKQPLSNTVIHDLIEDFKETFTNRIVFQGYTTLENNTVDFSLPQNKEVTEYITRHVYSALAMMCELLQTFVSLTLSRVHANEVKQWELDRPDCPFQFDVIDFELAEFEYSDVTYTITYATSYDQPIDPVEE